MANCPSLLRTFLVLPLEVWGPQKPLSPGKWDRLVTLLEATSAECPWGTHPPSGIYQPTPSSSTWHPTQGGQQVRPFPDSHMPKSHRSSAGTPPPPLPSRLQPCQA